MSQRVAAVEPRALRDVREAAAAVAPQPALAVVGDEQIAMAVVVVVADADALAPSGLREPRARGDVLESQAAEVAIEMR